MKRRNPIVLSGAAIIAALFVGCLLPLLASLTGCGGVAITKQPTASLSPHYLANLPPPAFEPDHPVVGHAFRNSDGTLATVITYHFEKGNGSSSQREHAIRGIGQWNREPPPTPDWNLVADDAPAAVTVRFVDSGGSGSSDLPQNVQGSAHWFPASAPTSGVILLNRGIVIPSELVSTACHEAGHVGFSGDDNDSDPLDRDHSPQQGDVMFWQVPRHISTLSTRDANSFARCYGAAPKRLEPASVPQVWGRVDCRFEKE
jgi:hypothetical protein